MIDLLYPRNVTRLLLLTLGAGIGFLAFRHLPVSLLAYASGLAAPFCMLCAAAVWAMRDKADDALSGEHLNSEGFKRSRAAAAALRTKFLLRAAWLSICALAAAGPAVSAQMSNSVWEWMAIASGVAVGEAAYTFLLANAWDEQLRAVRERNAAEGKRREEAARLIEALDGSRLQAGGGIAGWTEKARELQPHQSSH